MFRYIHIPYVEKGNMQAFTYECAFQKPGIHSLGHTCHTNISFVTFCLETKAMYSTPVSVSIHV